MSETKQLEGMPADAIDNARTGYQVAIEMWGKMGDEVWTKFNVMLVANSIVIAVVGVLLTSQRVLPTLATFLPIVGIILCLLWVVMMQRGFDYQVYYLLCAKELEEQYLAGTVATLSRGATFASGKTISIKTNDGLITRRMSFLSRRLTGQAVSYLVIILFVIVYVVLLLQK